MNEVNEDRIVAVDRRHLFARLRASGILSVAFVDRSGRIVDASTGFWQLFGYEAAAPDVAPFHHITVHQLVVRESRLSLKRVLDSTWRYGRSGRRELQFCASNGHRFWALLQIEKVNGVEEAVAYFLDTSPLHEKEQQLQDSASMLERAQRIGRMGHWTYDVASGLMTWSPQATRVLLGDDEFDWSMADPWIPIDPKDRTRVQADLHRAIAEKGSFQSSAKVLRADGQDRVVYFEGDVDLNGHGEPLRIVGVVQDITDRVATEQALKDARRQMEERVALRTAELARANEALEKEIAERVRLENARGELLAQVVTAQEDERARIARELHDEMGQIHAALLLGLKSLETSRGVTGEMSDRIHYLQSLANQVGRAAHDLAARLRPAALEDLGLTAALCQYAETWSDQVRVKIDLHTRGLETNRLPAPIESSVYRIVQEALTNVAKHADAENVSIIVERQDQHLLVIVEDDGKGFSWEKFVESSAANKKKLGLLGMQERVAAMGGKLEVESSRQGGTTVFVRVPLKR